jgi:phosphoglycolate phosphatase-like HAD superfamily hydrolase
MEAHLWPESTRPGPCLPRQDFRRALPYRFGEEGTRVKPGQPFVLESFQPESAYFIGIDSDGCVFDVMALKHKECFCPAFINWFGLQGSAGPARETWEFVNLYSRSRGLNRFKAVAQALHLLNRRPEVVAQQGAEFPTAALDEWISGESKLGEPALQAYLTACPERDAGPKLLQRSLNWSKDVAAAVERIVHDLPPMREAADVLRSLEGCADCLVVSQAATRDLKREWAEHAIDTTVRGMAGQELGTKSEHLRLATGGKYAPGRVLMVGDAPGDHQAATDNRALFFPIVPGRERASWRQLGEEGLDRFFRGTFAGDYQQKLIEEFYVHLPETPPWEA